MRIPRLKISLAAALAVVGLTAAVALGAPARTTGSSPIQKAFAKTGKISSGQFSFTLSISGGAAAQTGKIALGGAGSFDVKHQASQFKLDLGPLAAALGSLGGSKGGSIPQKIDIVTLKTTVYIHIPSLAAQAGGAGKEWLKLDTNSLPKSSTGGINAGQLTKTNQAKALAALSASISVHKVGSTTVRGSSTSHYVAKVDVVKVVKALIPKAQQAAQLKSLHTAGISTLPVDIYIDHSGYVRRVAVVLKNLKSQGAPPTSVSISVDIFGIGHPAHVSAPPASKTADGSKLLNGLLGGLGGG